MKSDNGVDKIYRICNIFTSSSDQFKKWNFSIDKYISSKNSNNSNNIDNYQYNWIIHDHISDKLIIFILF